MSTTKWSVVYITRMIMRLDMLSTESFPAFPALTIVCSHHFNVAYVETALTIFFYNSVKEGHLILRALIFLGILLLCLFLRLCLLLLVLAKWF